MDLCGGVVGVDVMKGLGLVYWRWRWLGLAAPHGRIVSGDVLFQRRFLLGVCGGPFPRRAFRRRGALGCVELLFWLGRLAAGVVVALPGVVILVLGTVTVFGVGFGGW